MREKRGEVHGSRTARVLQATAIFAQVPLEDLMTLEEGAWQRSYGAGQVVATEDFDEAILLIEQGALRLFRTSEAGNEITIAAFAPGDIIGLSLWARTFIASGMMEAGEDETIVHVLPREQCQNLLRRHPASALATIELLGQRLAESCNRIADLAFHPVRTRLAHELAHLAGASDRGCVYSTHEELAARIGSNQSEVTRSLKVLREEHLIESTPRCRGITVLNAEALTRY